MQQYNSNTVIQNKLVPPKQSIGTCYFKLTHRRIPFHDSGWQLVASVLINYCIRHLKVMTQSLSEYFSFVRKSKVTSVVT